MGINSLNKFMKRIKQNKRPCAFPQEDHRLAGDGAAHGDLNTQSRQAAQLAAGGCRGGSERAFCPKQPSVWSSKLRRPADRDERGVTEATPSLEIRKQAQKTPGCQRESGTAGLRHKAPSPPAAPPQLPAGLRRPGCSVPMKTSCVKSLLPLVQTGT